MGALSTARKIVKIDGAETLRKVPVDAGAVIWHGAMVAKLAGYATPAAPGSDKVIGVAQLTFDDLDAQGIAAQLGTKTGNVVENTVAAGYGSAGQRHIAVERGVFKFGNKSGDLVDETMIGDDCYVEDDQTVRKTGAASIVAGTVYGLDDDGGVFVQVPAGAYGRA